MAGHQTSSKTLQGDREELIVLTPADMAKDVRKIHALLATIESEAKGPIARVLLVGCGAGGEARELARHFGAETIGIDIGATYAFDPEAAYPATLMVMDVRQMGFPDGAFDLVYSFHALEHIPEPHRALAEMARVLRRDGLYCIGTPNRSRLIGYIDDHFPLADRIRWNLNDTRMRLAGRFRNEFGAHAGFTPQELTAMCRAAFGAARDVSEQYYRSSYKDMGPFIGALTRSGLSRIIFPCVYVAGRKP